jgi:putative glutamine amidotransferase
LTPSDNTRPLIGIPAASLSDSEFLATPYYRFNGLYPAALAAAGATPVVVPLELPEEILADLFARLDGLLLAGGLDVHPREYGELAHPRLGRVDPVRDATELLLARRALSEGLPLLGICRGIQLLNVAAGGTLYQDLPSQLPEALVHDRKLVDTPWERAVHTVEVAAGSRLARALQSIRPETNSYHHQAVKVVGAPLVPVAWTADGVIEGLEAPTHPFALAVQWHPEGMVRVEGHALRLFEAFVAAAHHGGL